MYPKEWEADIVARDGAILHVRPVEPSDAAALQQMDAAQSERSRFLRFFGHRGPLTPAELARFTDLDQVRHVGLGVFHGDQLLAYGCYDAVDDLTAEVAFYVADQQQGRGLGSLLLDHLAAAGRQRGFVRFVAEVLPQNHRMLAVFADAGYRTTSRLEDGVVDVSIDLATTQDSWRVLTQREHRAESLAIRAVMAPARIVGVGDVPAPWGVPAWDGGPLDGGLAVVGDRAGTETITALARAGAGAAVMLDDADPGVLAAARSAAVRLLGPYSFGVAHAWNLTWDRQLATGGSTGVFTQSRRTSLNLLQLLHPLQLRSFVSAGRRLDVSGNDVMQWWLDDDGVEVAALALNSIGNPRKFARIGRRLAASRPVACWVAQTTGSSAPEGHAVRTSNLPRAVLSGMLRQCGMIEARNVPQLAQLTRLLSALPDVPRAVRALGSTPSASQAVTGALTRAGVALSETSPLAVALDEPLPREERAPQWRPADVTVVGVRTDGDVRVDTLDAAVDLVARLCAWRRPEDSELLTPASRPEVARAALDGACDVAAVLGAYGVRFEPGARAEGEVVRIRAVEDPLYGPVIAFGRAGDAFDVFGDVSYRIAPLTRADVGQMVREPRALALTEAQIAPLVEFISQVAALKDDFPDLELLDLEPVYVSAAGATVAGARLRVARADRADDRVRALSTPSGHEGPVEGADVGE